MTYDGAVPFLPPLLRRLVALIGALGLAVMAGCGGDAGVPAPGKVGTEVTLAAGTCWTDQTLSADPQEILALSQQYAVDYFAAAHAVDQRPAFALTQACDKPHHVEVYKTVPIAEVRPAVTNFADFLQYGKPAYAKLVAAVERACMGETLQAVAREAKVAGALVEPVFPDGVELGWAPPSPDQWSKGQRSYACTVASATPIQFRYSAIFDKALPVSERTCITNRPLAFVDCARKHDRERIAVIDVRAAVEAKKFPGPRAIKVGSQGRFVEVSPPVLAALDRACTLYLKAISTTTRFTGVAQIDASRWPAPDGSYPVDCEADTPPAKDSISTEGSVFNK